MRLYVPMYGCVCEGLGSVHVCVLMDGRENEWVHRGSVDCRIDVWMYRCWFLVVCLVGWVM